MKYLIASTLVLFSFFAFAGGYYSPSIDQYDQATGLYFKSVKLEKESGFLSSNDEVIVNIYIYDPSKDSGYYLFPENHEQQIVALSFETALKRGVVEFNSSYSSPVKNNTGIIDREPKQTILVVTRDSKKQTDTFFIANKITGNPKKIGQIHSKSNWHIDVKNSKIRIVNQVDNKIVIKSLAW